MKFGILLNFCICFVGGQLINGDDCENNKGKCILLKDCPSVMQAFRNGIYPETCGFQQKHPLVCCAQNDATTNRISEIKCKKYSAKTQSASTSFSLDFSEPQVVGGMLSVAKEFPHMAALGYRSRYNIIFLCGGCLISEKFILTAAHCLTSLQYGPVQIIRLGEVNIGSSSRSSSKYYGIRRRIPHPFYKSSSVYNDIALIELEDSVQFNDFIKPACLHINHEIPSNIELIVTGWGLTKYGGNKIDTLQKASLDLFTDEECNNTYSNEGLRKLKNGIIHESQFCAGGRNSIRDSCQGDSGGPLQTQLSTEKIYSIVGINSFGKACDIPNEPGIYTRVSFYVPWIESVIWPI